MRNQINTLIMVLLIITASCSKDNQRQITFEKTKQSRNYQLIAVTNIDGDKIEFWKDVRESHEPYYGKILIAAIAKSGDLLDFCAGEFVSSERPFFQSSRYVALVAGTGFRKDKVVFFVYDSHKKKFIKHSLDKYISHIHRNILIMGDAAFFASCMESSPVGRLNLITGQVTMFNPPAPQHALFYVVNSNVHILGEDLKAYRIGEKELIEADINVHKDHIIEMAFDEIMIDNKKIIQRAEKDDKRDVLFLDTILRLKFDRSVSRSIPLIIDQNLSIEDLCLGENKANFMTELIHRTEHKDTKILQAVKDFCSKNTKNHNIDSIGSLTVRHVVMTKEQETDLFRTRGKDGWEEFYKIYPKSPGIITLSRPGFSKDGTIAVIYIGNQRHGVVGEGQIYVFQKIDGKWVECGTHIGPIWVS